jgi:hypothetical protein
MDIQVGFLPDVCPVQLPITVGLTNENVGCSQLNRPPPPPGQAEYQNCGGDRDGNAPPFSKRATIFAAEGMAATSQPIATQIAIDILKVSMSACLSLFSCVGQLLPYF